MGLVQQHPGRATPSVYRSFKRYRHPPFIFPGQVIDQFFAQNAHFESTPCSPIAAGTPRSISRFGPFTNKDARSISEQRPQPHRTPTIHRLFMCVQSRAVKSYATVLDAKLVTIKLDRLLDGLCHEIIGRAASSKWQQSTIQKSRLRTSMSIRCSLMRPRALSSFLTQPSESTFPVSIK